MNNIYAASKANNERQEEKSASELHIRLLSCSITFNKTHPKKKFNVRSVKGMKGLVLE